MDTPGLSGPEVEDIVSEGIEHQADQEKDPDLLGQLAAADAQGPALHRFDREEGEVPAVEDRDRQEIEHAEVDAEDGNQEGVVREARSEEHTSELQSRLHLVCRLLLEKKKHKTGAARRGPFPRASPGR